MGALGAFLVGMLALAQAQSTSEFSPESPEGQAVLLVVAVALLSLGLLQIPVGRWLDRRLLRSAPEPPGAFVLMDFFVVLAIFIMGQVVVTLAYSWVVTGQLDPPETFFDDLGALGMLGLTAAGQAIPAAYVLYLALRRRGGLTALGVTGTTPGWRLTYAFGRYVTALPMLFGLIALTTFLFLVLGMEAPQQDAALLVSDGLATDPIPIALFVAVVIPLLEEILFRGFILELLASRIGKVGGVLLSSALFGILHGGAAFLPIFGLALVLATVKLRTRSLAAAWFLHALHNGAQTLMLHYGASPV